MRSLRTPLPKFGDIPLKELKKSTLVEERIDGTTFTFDKNECALIFKKLRSVMGEEEEEEYK